MSEAGHTGRAPRLGALERASADPGRAARYNRNGQCGMRMEIFRILRFLRAGARRARASLVSDVEKRQQTVSDYTAARWPL